MSAQRLVWDRRLLLLPAAAAAGAGVLTAVYVSGDAEAKLNASFHRLGGSLSESFAVVAQEALSSRNEFLLASAAGRMARLPAVREAWVVGADGRLLAHTDSARVGEAMDGSLLARVRAAASAGYAARAGLRVYGRDIGGEKPLGFAAVALTDQWVSAASRELSVALWVGALLCAASGAFAGLLLRRDVLAARADLIASADEAGRAAEAGRLDRVSVDRRDEWGDVSRAILEALRRTAGRGAA